MKKRGYFPIFAITLSIFLTLIIGAAQAEKVVKVQIHTVQGGKVTEANLIEGIKAANQADGPYIRFVIDSNHVHRPGSTPKDANLNDKGRINIWGLDKCVVTGEPNYISGQTGNIIEIVPGFKPSGPNDPNVWLKPSTLAHEIDHILLGPAHSDDPNNKMYPDNEEDENGVYHSCHRKGMQLTPEQIQKLKDTNVPYAQNAVHIGIGAEDFDVVGDVPFPGLDIFWTQGWMEWIHGEHIVHLSVEYDVVSFFDLPGADGGFLINSDGDPATGQPPDGMDCFLAYSPHMNEIIFQKYDSMMGIWLNMPPEGISYELMYVSKDANVPPKETGVKFTAPLNVLLPLQGGYISGNFVFKAVARTTEPPLTDFAPDANTLKITYPPNPIPGDLNLDNKVDEADLEIMTWDWPEIGISRADIFPPVGDGKVDFLDYAILANNWLIGMP